MSMAVGRRRVWAEGACLALLVTILVRPASAQFDLFQWTWASPSGTGSGSVHSDEMVIAGPDHPFGGRAGGSTNGFTTVAPYALTVVASYDLENFDTFGTGYDLLVALVDGTEIELDDGGCSNCDLVFSVPAGAVSGFGGRRHGPAVLGG